MNLCSSLGTAFSPVGSSWRPFRRQTKRYSVGGTPTAVKSRSSGRAALRRRSSSWSFWSRTCFRGPTLELSARDERARQEEDVARLRSESAERVLLLVFLARSLVRELVSDLVSVRARERKAQLLHELREQLAHGRVVGELDVELLVRVGAHERHRDLGHRSLRVERNTLSGNPMVGRPGMGWRTRAGSREVVSLIARELEESLATALIVSRPHDMERREPDLGER